MIKLKGWRGEPHVETLKTAIKVSSCGKESWRNLALVLLDGGDIKNQSLTKNTKNWLRCRAKWVMKQIVKDDPEKYGFVKVNPNEINKDMTTKELLDFCGTGKKELSELIAKAPQNGLPKPSKKLGRTLRGRAYIFPVNVAREYARRLIS